MQGKVESVLVNHFSERLKTVVPSGSGRAFAKKAGIGYSTVHNYLSGVSSPTLENLVALARAADVSVEWLATGIEKSSRSSGVNPKKFVNCTSKIPYLGQEKYLVLDDELLRSQNLHIDNAIALKAGTDVMEPTFSAESILVIDKSVGTLRENQLVVLNRGNDYLFKRVQVQANGYNLLSDNKKYPMIVVSESEVVLFKVIGEIKFVINLFTDPVSN